MSPSVSPLPPPPSRRCSTWWSSAAARTCCVGPRGLRLGPASHAEHVADDEDVDHGGDGHDSDAPVQALRRGVNDYIINKHPFDEHEVRQVVRRAMNEAQLRRENMRLQRELTLANQQLRDYGAQLERTPERWPN